MHINYKEYQMQAKHFLWLFKHTLLLHFTWKEIGQSKDAMSKGLLMVACFKVYIHVNWFAVKEPEHMKWNKKLQTIFPLNPIVHLCYILLLLLGYLYHYILPTDCVTVTFFLLMMSLHFNLCCHYILVIYAVTTFLQFMLLLHSSSLCCHNILSVYSVLHYSNVCLLLHSSSLSCHYILQFMLSLHASSLWCPYIRLGLLSPVTLYVCIEKYPE